MKKDIYLAGGCFWGIEHLYKQVQGVLSTEVGFANGRTAHPSYREVYTDTTGHAETVHVVYDEQEVSLPTLLELFFVAIDPLSMNKQGEDEGTRYRTGIYYTDETQLPVIKTVIAKEQKKYTQPIVVEVEPLQAFYSAEEEHQDYLDKHPDGYCHLSPALFAYARKLKEKN